MTTGRSTHHQTITKRILAPIGVMAVLASSIAVALPAQAEGGNDAMIATVASSGEFTPWQESDEAPADTDLQQIGKRFEKWVPGTDHVEYEWATESPGEDWVRRPRLTDTADEVISATHGHPAANAGRGTRTARRTRPTGLGTGSTPLTDPDHWQENTSHHNGTDRAGPGVPAGPRQRPATTPRGSTGPTLRDTEADTVHHDLLQVQEGHPHGSHRVPLVDREAHLHAGRG